MESSNAVTNEEKLKIADIGYGVMNKDVPRAGIDSDLCAWAIEAQGRGFKRSKAIAYRTLSYHLWQAL
jgi:hypothetical protein